MNPEKILADMAKDLQYRMDNMNARNGAYWLIEEGFSAEFLIQFSYAHVLRAIERRGTLVEVSSSIGRRLRQRQKLRQSSVAEIHAGWFVLISFIDLGLVSYTKEKTKKYNKTSQHRSFVLQAEDWTRLKSLMETIEHENCDMFPVNAVPAPWEAGQPYHLTTGTPIIKKGSALQLNPFKDPVPEMGVLFDALNKLQSTGWRINEKTFEVYEWFMDHGKKLRKSPFKFRKEIDKKKRKSMMIEAEAVRHLAQKNLGKPFYHLYNFDFRGRIYPNTAFLHEQSSDNAKGILMLDEPRPLGEDGLDWLFYHAANCWGEDKLPKADRIQWGKDQYTEMEMITRDPTNCTFWLDAEKPFSYLSACHEIVAAVEWGRSGDIREFPSCLPIFIDGSNNGVQHLAAMSRDTEVAPLVNLIPQDTPGDVYMFIANKVRERVAEMVKETPRKIVGKFNDTFEEGKRLQAEYADAPANSESKRIAYNRLINWKQKNRNLREKLFPVYWNRIDDPKLWRKTVKRNVMTLGYGGTEYGMGQQIIEDTRSLSDYLRDKDYLWGVLMGNLVYDTCYKELKGPARMLRLFETLAERANETKQPLRWRSPVTRFPVVQEYRKAKSVRVKLRHGDDEIKVQIQIWEEATLNEGKQRQSAAPNIVHSLDAVHLTLTVVHHYFPVVVVHDSFGCHAGNMSELFMGVRDTFVDLYEADPLGDILLQMDAKDLEPMKGNLNVADVRESDFAFA